MKINVEVIGLIEILHSALVAEGVPYLSKNYQNSLKAYFKKDLLWVKRFPWKGSTMSNEVIIQVFVPSQKN